MERKTMILTSLLAIRDTILWTRRLKAIAIIAAISGLTYKVCDYMFFI